MKSFTAWRLDIDEEGIPANSAGGGNVAGIGVGKDGEPGRKLKSQPILRRKTKKVSVGGQ